MTLILFLKIDIRVRAKSKTYFMFLENIRNRKFSSCGDEVGGKIVSSYDAIKKRTGQIRRCPMTKNRAVEIKMVGKFPAFFVSALSSCKITMKINSHT